jgi:hypothetical protein
VPRTMLRMEWSTLVAYHQRDTFGNTTADAGRRAAAQNASGSVALAEGRTMPREEYLTIPEVVAQLRIPRSTFYYWLLLAAARPCAEGDKTP